MNRCKSCKAEIRWALTPKGRRIPLDPGEAPEGNLVLVEDPRHIDPPTAYGVAEAEERGLKGQRVISHFATCAQAKQHRRRSAP